MLPDTEGFAIPFADDDQYIECTACDLEAGEPTDWPEWVDEDRWEPSHEDSIWAAQNLELPPAWEPSDADLEEMAAWSAHLDRLEELNRENDAEYEVRCRYAL